MSKSLRRVQENQRIVEAQFREARSSIPNTSAASRVIDGELPPLIVEQPMGRRAQPRWPWWEWLFFPLALVVTALQFFMPWIGQRGIFKLFAVFMSLWLIFGTVAVTFDSKAGTGSRIGSIEYLSKYYCWELERVPAGGWPLGKLYLVGVNCAGYVPHQIALNLDQPGLADAIERNAAIVKAEYWYEGIWSLSYVWLGLLWFFTLVTLPIWIMAMILKPVLSNLHVSWGAE